MEKNKTVEFMGLGHTEVSTIQEIAELLSKESAFDSRENSYSLAAHGIRCAKALLNEGRSTQSALVALLHYSSMVYYNQIPKDEKPTHLPKIKGMYAAIEKTVYDRLTLHLPTGDEIFLSERMVLWQRSEIIRGKLPMKKKEPIVEEVEFLAMYKLLRTDIGSQIIDW